MKSQSIQTPISAVHTDNQICAAKHERTVLEAVYDKTWFVPTANNGVLTNLTEILGRPIAPMANKEEFNTHHIAHECHKFVLYKYFEPYLAAHLHAARGQWVVTISPSLSQASKQLQLCLLHGARLHVIASACHHDATRMHLQNPSTPFERALCNAYLTGESLETPQYHITTEPFEETTFHVDTTYIIAINVSYHIDALSYAVVLSQLCATADLYRLQRPVLLEFFAAPPELAWLTFAPAPGRRVRNSLHGYTLTIADIPEVDRPPSHNVLGYEGVFSRGTRAVRGLLRNTFQAIMQHIPIVHASPKFKRVVLCDFHDADFAEALDCSYVQSPSTWFSNMCAGKSCDYAGFATKLIGAAGVHRFQITASNAAPLEVVPQLCPNVVRLVLMPDLELRVDEIKWDPKASLIVPELLLHRVCTQAQSVACTYPIDDDMNDAELRAVLSKQVSAVNSLYTLQENASRVMDANLLSTLTGLTAHEKFAILKFAILQANQLIAHQIQDLVVAIRSTTFWGNVTRIFKAMFRAFRLYCFAPAVPMHHLTEFAADRSKYFNGFSNLMQTPLQVYHADSILLECPNQRVWLEQSGYFHSSAPQACWQRLLWAARQAHGLLDAPQPPGFEHLTAPNFDNLAQLTQVITGLFYLSSLRVRTVEVKLHQLTTVAHDVRNTTFRPHWSDTKVAWRNFTGSIDVLVHQLGSTFHVIVGTPVKPSYHSGLSTLSEADLPADIPARAVYVPPLAIIQCRGDCIDNLSRMSTFETRTAMQPAATSLNDLIAVLYYGDGFNPVQPFTHIAPARTPPPFDTVVFTHTDGATHYSTLEGEIAEPFVAVAATHHGRVKNIARVALILNEQPDLPVVYLGSGNQDRTGWLDAFGEPSAPVHFVDPLIPPDRPLVEQGKFFWHACTAQEYFDLRPKVRYILIDDVSANAGDDAEHDFVSEEYIKDPNCAAFSLKCRLPETFDTLLLPPGSHLQHLPYSTQMNRECVITNVSHGFNHLEPAQRHDIDEGYEFILGELTHAQVRTWFLAHQKSRKVCTDYSCIDCQLARFMLRERLAHTLTRCAFVHQVVTTHIPDQIHGWLTENDDPITPTKICKRSVYRRPAPMNAWGLELLGEYNECVRVSLQKNFADKLHRIPYLCAEPGEFKAAEETGHIYLHAAPGARKSQLFHVYHKQKPLMHTIVVCPFRELAREWNASFEAGSNWKAFTYQKAIFEIYDALLEGTLECIVVDEALALGPLLYLYAACATANGVLVGPIDADMAVTAPEQDLEFYVLTDSEQVSFVDFSDAADEEPPFVALTRRPLRPFTEFEMYGFALLEHCGFVANNVTWRCPGTITTVLQQIAYPHLRHTSGKAGKVIVHPARTHQEAEQLVLEVTRNWTAQDMIIPLNQRTKAELLAILPHGKERPKIDTSAASQGLTKRFVLAAAYSRGQLPPLQLDIWHQRVSSHMATVCSRATDELHLVHIIGDDVCGTLHAFGARKPPPIPLFGAVAEPPLVVNVPVTFRTEANPEVADPTEKVQRHGLPLLGRAPKLHIGDSPFRPASDAEYAKLIACNAGPPKARPNKTAQFLGTLHQPIAITHAQAQFVCRGAPNVVTHSHSIARTPGLSTIITKDGRIRTNDGGAYIPNGLGVVTATPSFFIKHRPIPESLPSAPVRYAALGTLDATADLRAQGVLSKYYHLQPSVNNLFPLCPVLDSRPLIGSFHGDSAMFDPVAMFHGGSNVKAFCRSTFNVGTLQTADNPMATVFTQCKRYASKTFMYEHRRLHQQRRNDNEAEYKRYFEHDSEWFCREYLTNDQLLDLDDELAEAATLFTKAQVDKGGAMRDVSFDQFLRDPVRTTLLLKSQHKFRATFDTAGKSAVDTPKSFQPVNVLPPAWTAAFAPVCRLVQKLYYGAMGPRVQWMGPDITPEGMLHKMHQQWNYEATIESDVSECDASHVPFLRHAIAADLRYLLGRQNALAGRPYHTHFEFVDHFIALVAVMMNSWTTARRKDPSKSSSAEHLEYLIEFASMFALLSGLGITFLINCRWCTSCGINAFTANGLPSWRPDHPLRAYMPWAMMVAGDDGSFTYRARDHIQRMGLASASVSDRVVHFGVSLKQAWANSGFVFCNFVYDQTGVYPNLIRLLAKTHTRLFRETPYQLRSAIETHKQSVWDLVKQFADPQKRTDCIISNARVLNVEMSDAAESLDYLLKYTQTPTKFLRSQTTKVEYVAPHHYVAGGAFDF
jgi:hypothetical protein